MFLKNLLKCKNFLLKTESMQGRDGYRKGAAGLCHLFRIL